MPALAATDTTARWVRRWRDLDIPILDSSAQELELWRANEDEADARLLAEAFGTDPLMCLKLLAHVARRHAKPDAAGAETLTEALVMLGIGPFFRQFGPQVVVQQHLAAQPEALAGLQAVLARSRRAACFALGFAVHRMDPQASLIHEAALLHDFAEMLLWCHEPTLALQLSRRLRAEPGLRSAQAQLELLGTPLAEVQHALMLAWRLPPLLVHISDDAAADEVRVRNVLLAMRLARHTAESWDNPAVPDDVADIGALLMLNEQHTRNLLHDLDDQAS
jgi:HD-like signal output (HDOD) protein